MSRSVYVFHRSILTKVLYCVCILVNENYIFIGRNPEDDQLLIETAVGCTQIEIKCREEPYLSSCTVFPNKKEKRLNNMRNIT